MNKEQYRSYLLTPVWKDLRAKAFKLHGKSCKKCGAQFHLQIHHRTYVRVGGNEDVQLDLVPLCDTCHGIIHEIVANESLTIAAATQKFLGETITPTKKKKLKRSKKYKKHSFEISYSRRHQPPARANSNPHIKKAASIDFAKLMKLYNLEAVPNFLR